MYEGTELLLQVTLPIAMYELDEYRALCTYLRGEWRLYAHRGGTYAVEVRDYGGTAVARAEYTMAAGSWVDFSGIAAGALRRMMVADEECWRRGECGCMGGLPMQLVGLQPLLGEIAIVAGSGVDTFGGGGGR